MWSKKIKPRRSPSPKPEDAASGAAIRPPSQPGKRAATSIVRDPAAEHPPSGGSRARPDGQIPQSHAGASPWAAADPGRRPSSPHHPIGTRLPTQHGTDACARRSLARSVRRGSVSPLTTELSRPDNRDGVSGLPRASRCGQLIRQGPPSRDVSAFS